MYIKVIKNPIINIYQNLIVLRSHIGNLHTKSAWYYPGDRGILCVPGFFNK